MATITRLTPGQVVYSVESVKMGNTSIRRKALYTIRIIEIDLEKQQVLASWNSNPPRRYGLTSIQRWRVNKPKPKGNAFGMPTY